MATATKTKQVLDTDLFGSAVVAVKPVKKNTKATDAVGEDLDILAWTDTVIDNLVGVRELYETKIKLEARKIYIDRGIENGNQPENLSLLSPEQNTASAEFRKRSSASKLTADDIAILEANNIPYETAIVKEEHFYFNPELIADESARAAICEALAKVPSLKGKQILMKQEQEVKYIVADESLNRAFQTIESRSMLEAVMDIVSVQALKIKSNISVPDALQKLKDKGLTEILGFANKTRKVAKK